MIEDKELGLKIAESPLEALWGQVLRESELLIKQSENNLIIQNAINKLAKEKLDEIKK